MTPLPCPFCGREPKRADRAEESATGRVWFIVCYCGGNAARAHQWGHTEEGVLEKWNKRSTPPEALRSEILEEAADLCDQKLDHYSGTEYTYHGDMAEAIRAIKSFVEPPRETPCGCVKVCSIEGISFRGCHGIGYRGCQQYPFSNNVEARQKPEDRNTILQAAIEFAQHALKKRADKWKSMNNHGRQDEALECRKVIAQAISGLKSSVPSPRGKQ